MSIFRSFRALNVASLFPRARKLARGYFLNGPPDLGNIIFETDSGEPPYME
jgi:hypothetical protein